MLLPLKKKRKKVGRGKFLLHQSDSMSLACHIYILKEEKEMRVKC